MGGVGPRMFIYLSPQSAPTLVCERAGASVGVRHCLLRLAEEGK